MTSERKRLSAQRNGAKSRGPVTTAGKLRSCLNSTVHGLTARTHLLLPGEDASAFQAMAAQMEAEHQPQTSAEHLCLAQMIAAQWRLARSWQVEGALHSIVLSEQEPLLSRADDPYQNYAEAFRTLSMPGGTFSPMLHYQTRLERSYDSALKRLRQLQGERNQSKTVEPNPNNGHRAGAAQ